MTGYDSDSWLAYQATMRAQGIDPCSEEWLGALGNEEFSELAETTRDAILVTLRRGTGLTFDQVAASVEQTASEYGGERERAIRLGIIQARRRIDDERARRKARQPGSAKRRGSVRQ